MSSCLSAVQARERWAGPVVPVLTIFNEDLSLDLGGLRTNVQYLLDTGAQVGNTVLLVCGAGGDFPVLTTEERKTVTETVMEVVGDRIPVIVGCEHTSTLTVTELAQHALQVGADAVQICPPYYYTPSVDDVVYHFQYVSDAVDIGIVLYNTWWTAPNVGLEGLGKLAQIERLIGVKWSSPVSSEYQLGYDQFAARLAFIDNMVNHVYCHMQGGVAWISHVSNFWPQHDWKILKLMQAGEYQKAQQTINGFNAAFRQFRREMETRTGGEGHSIKKIMEMVGLAGGVSRPPSRTLPMTDAQRESLAQVLRERITVEE